MIVTLPFVFVYPIFNVLFAGRWAQRVDSQGITVKSHFTDPSVIPFPAPKLDSAAEEQASSMEQQKVVSAHDI